jgi:hypothetical protein
MTANGIAKTMTANGIVTTMTASGIVTTTTMTNDRVDDNARTTTGV